MLLIVFSPLTLCVWNSWCSMSHDVFYKIYWHLFFLVLLCLSQRKGLQLSRFSARAFRLPRMHNRAALTQKKIAFYTQWESSQAPGYDLLHLKPSILQEKTHKCTMVFVRLVHASKTKKRQMQEWNLFETLCKSSLNHKDAAPPTPHFTINQDTKMEGPLQGQKSLKYAHTKIPDKIWPTQNSLLKHHLQFLPFFLPSQPI